MSDHRFYRRVIQTSFVYRSTSIRNILLGTPGTIEHFAFQTKRNKFDRIFLFLNVRKRNVITMINEIIL